MNVTFQKNDGNPSMDILFFWKMAVDAKTPVTVTNHFIPEPFYDYLFIKKGKVTCIDELQGVKFILSRQTLKTIYNHPVRFEFSTPLVLFGARLSLGFAESFWEKNVPANSFLAQTWVREDTNDLESFAAQVIEYIRQHRTFRNPYPMLGDDLEESNWLIHFSPRHKRRLYRSTFGLSRKELRSIHNVHSFLEQTCDFDTHNPRIIQHVNPEVFYDQPHFNHTFKKITGFSPVEYFQANSILQDNLMSASYNEIYSSPHRIRRRE